MRHYLWMVIGAGLSVLLAGCQGGGGNELPDSGVVVPITDPRTAPADDPATAVIEGRVILAGLTLPAIPDSLAGVASAITQLPEERIMVRLLDPTEDILIASVHPDLGGRFTITTITPVVNARLEVNLAVLEDLNGNAVSDDLVNQAVPLTLRPGQVALVELKLSRSLPRQEPGAVLNNNPAIADALLPDAGFMLLAELKVQDGSGYHEDFYGVNYLTGSVVYDTDGDRALEEFDDYNGADTNTDGWADAFEELFAQPQAPATTLLVGYVTSVNQGLSQLTIQRDDLTFVVIDVDPFVAIEELNSTAAGGAGQFFGPVILDVALIGKFVQVEARPTATGYLASWIVVIDEPAISKK